MLFNPKSESLVVAQRRNENGEFGKSHTDKTNIKVCNTKGSKDVPVVNHRPREQLQATLCMEDFLLPIYILLSTRRR